MINSNDPGLRSALYVIKTECGRFLAVDNGSGYPYWTPNTYAARIYHDIDHARHEWNQLKSSFYNRDRDVYPSVVELLFSEKTKLTF